MTESWLTRNVRPLTCLGLTATAIVGAFIPTAVIAPQLWEVLQIALGTYVAGRSLEKIVRGGGLPWQKPRRGQDES